MIPLTTLYDEYIDRLKLGEQKNKPICVYSSSPLKRGLNNKRWTKTFYANVHFSDEFTIYDKK